MLTQGASEEELEVELKREIKAVKHVFMQDDKKY